MALPLNYKAQVGTEYIIVFAFSLIVIALLWSFTNQDIENIRWDIKVAYAKSSASKIIEAAEAAYVQGPPSQFYIRQNFPEDINRIYIGQNQISIEIIWKNGVLRNVTADTIANITGNISPASGSKKLLIKAEGNFVNITEV